MGKRMTVFLILAALFVASVGASLKWADLNEAAIEARNPPNGTFVEIGGRNVHVIVKGEGPDLVLIHGAGGTASDMDIALGERLADRYRLFIVDRPGHGWTDQTDPKMDGPWTNRADSPREQARFLAAATRQLGADKPLVLGHSYGGAVAMAWALEEPTSGVVILAGVTMPWPGPLDRIYRLLGSTFGGAVIAPFIPAFLPDTYLDATLTRVFKPDPMPANYINQAGIAMATRTRTLRANNRQVVALRPQVVEMAQHYATLEMPFEILHGTADKSVYAEIHAEPTVQVLPNAELTLLEGVGHMPHHVVPNDITAAIDRLAARAGLR